MFRRFFRHIKEGFIGVRRHFGMAFSSATAVTITLTMIGVFAVLVSNVAFLTQEIEQSISLVALIDYDVTDKTQLNSMQKQIENMDGVLSVTYRTKDQEFDYYNEQYPDMVEFSELYREDNPFHDVYIVSLTEGSNMSTIKTNISKINGISSVEDGGTNTYRLISILQETRLAGAIFVLALVLLAIYLIYNTIKVTIATRKDEIIIMRNVGAKNGYIRAPFLVEGIIIGVIGSIIPIGLIIYGYYRLYNLSGGVLAGVLSLIPVFPYILYLSLALLLIGIVVGFIGSYISVCKYLRLTR
jgi:cell division transport system permease protein